MQELIELSDSIRDSNILHRNNDQMNLNSNSSIEIIDLSLTDHTISRGNNISGTIEVNSPLPSSPTTCHINLVDNTCTSIDESSYYSSNENNNKSTNNNSVELSAPLIYDMNDEITDSSRHPNIRQSYIDLSVTSDNTRHGSNKRVLDNIIDDSDNDSSLHISLKDVPFDTSIRSLEDYNLETVDFKRQSIQIERNEDLLPTEVGRTDSDFISQKAEGNVELQSINISKSTFSNTSLTHNKKDRIKFNEKVESKPVPILDSLIDKSTDGNKDNNKNRDDSEILNNFQDTNNIIINHAPLSNNSNVTKKNGVTRNIRIRKIISRGNPLPEDIALDIPKFLKDSDSDSDIEEFSSLPNKRLKRSKSTQNQLTNVNLNNIVLPLSRAKTIDNHLLSVLNNSLIDDSRNLKTEFANLSRYIINGKTFTDTESKEIIQKSLGNSKDSFKRVNQLCKDNQKIREQIIVEISNSLLTIFEKENPNFNELLQPATIQKSYNDELPLIRFLRRVDSVYDFNHDYYYPCETQIMEENEVLLYYDTKIFFQQYSKDKRSLYKSIRKLVKRNKYVILVLYDLNKLKKTIELIEDYRYKESVNQNLTGTTTTTTNNCLNQRSNSRLKNVVMKEIEDLGMHVFDIEQRIRYIDRQWGIKIHTVNTHQDFLHSLSNLITLIAKKRMDPALRFMKYAHINVRSGSNKTDILKKTLNEIGRIPDLKVRGITKQYPNLQRLFQDFSIGQLQSGLDGRHLMTEKMEARLYKLFTCRNPDDVIE